MKEGEEELEVVPLEEEDLLPEGGVMRIKEARIAGGKITTIQRTNTLNMTQTGGNIEAMNGNQDPLGLAGVPDPQATSGGIENRDQDITPEGRIPETEWRIDIDRTATDRMDIGQIEALAGKGEEISELRGLVVMAMEGEPENTARGFQTWGILLQATLQS